MDTPSRYVRTEFVPSDSPVRASSSARRRKVKLSQKTLVFFKNALRKANEKLKGKYSETFEEVRDLASKGKSINNDVEFDIAFEKLQKLGVKIIETDYRMERLECIKEAKPVNVKAKFIEKIKAKISMLTSMPSPKTVGEIAYSSFEQSRTNLGGEDRNSEIERLENYENYIPEQSEIDKYMMGIAPAPSSSEEHVEETPNNEVEPEREEVEVPPTPIANFDVSEFLKNIQEQPNSNAPQNEENPVQESVVAESPVIPEQPEPQSQQVEQVVENTEEQVEVSETPVEVPEQPEPLSQQPAQPFQNVEEQNVVNEAPIEVPEQKPSILDAFVPPYVPFDFNLGNTPKEEKPAEPKKPESDALAEEFISARSSRDEAVQILNDTNNEMDELNNQIEELKRKRDELEAKAAESKKRIDESSSLIESVKDSILDMKIDELVDAGLDPMEIIAQCFAEYEKLFGYKMTKEQQMEMMASIYKKCNPDSDSIGGKRGNI